MADPEREGTASRTDPASPGLVAVRAAGGVVFGTASFTEFVAAHVRQLPEAERGPALIWLAGFESSLAAQRRASET